MIWILFKRFYVWQISEEKSAWPRAGTPLTDGSAKTKNWQTGHKQKQLWFCEALIWERSGLLESSGSAGRTGFPGSVYSRDDWPGWQVSRSEPCGGNRHDLTLKLCVSNRSWIFTHGTVSLQQMIHEQLGFIHSYQHCFCNSSRLTILTQ